VKPLRNQGLFSCRENGFIPHYYVSKRKGIGMRYSKFQIETMAAVLYGMAAFVPLLMSLLSTSPYAAYLLCFTIPMFFIGFLLFVVMDWGLKKFWNERSVLGLVPVVIVLWIPFIPALFTHFHDWFLSVALSGMLLIWSIFVVGLQLKLRPTQKRKEKSKNDL
jgi:hypothetical protein